MMDIQHLYEEFSMSKYVNAAHRDANILMEIANLRTQLSSMPPNEPLGWISNNYAKHLEDSAATDLRAYDRGNDVPVFLNPPSADVLVEALRDIARVAHLWWPN